MMSKYSHNEIKKCLKGQLSIQSLLSADSSRLVRLYHNNIAELSSLPSDITQLALSGSTHIVEYHDFSKAEKVNKAVKYRLVDFVNLFK